ncbi:MAG: NUDIX hydrolase [Lachnospiraceae bacterium]|jgi:ADP-ribose pyrophosphatase|nr:NUDIX hydrolase [Lachnospiraceae bacterium]
MEQSNRLNRELAYTGTILKVYRDTVVTNGVQKIYDFIHHDGAAAVLPVLEDGRILMVRQHRNALDRFTLEIPAGKLDAPDEPMIECAARELEEETGYRSDSLEYLMTINTTVAFCNERIGVYTAKNLIPSKQHLDDDECIDVEPWEVGDLLALIYDGKLCDAKTVAAITAYAQREGIR